MKDIIEAAVAKRKKDKDIELEEARKKDVDDANKCASINALWAELKPMRSYLAKHGTHLRYSKPKRRKDRKFDGSVKIKFGVTKAEARKEFGGMSQTGTHIVPTGEDRFEVSKIIESSWQVSEDIEASGSGKEILEWIAERTGSSSLLGKQNEIISDGAMMNFGRAYGSFLRKVTGR